MDKAILNKSMVIYLLTDTTNGMQYVGQTQKTLRERMSRHRSSDLLVDRAMKSHGWKNVSVEILEECNTVDELNRLEKEWIEVLNTKYPNGYNFADGGEGSPGHPCSEKTKALLAKIHTGKKHTAASLKKMSDATTEQMKNPAVREHLAEINRGKKASFETRKKMSKTRQGRRHTEASKLKLKAASTGKHPSPETCKKISESHKKHPGPRAVLNVETGVVYQSIAEAARACNISDKAISHVCRGRSMTAGGFHWIYVDDCPLLPDGSIDLETVRGVLL